MSELIEKKCTKCKLVQSVNNFHKNKNNKDGLRFECKDCAKVYKQANKELISISGKKRYQKNKHKIKLDRKLNPEKYKEKDKLYRKRNKEKIKERDKKNYIKNKEKVALRRKDYYKKNKEKLNNYGKEWRKRNKEKRKINKRLYDRKRKSENSLYKISCQFRSSLSTNLKKKNFSKLTKSEIILGCSFEVFKSNLEKQFKPWMTWENYGDPKDGIFEFNKTWDLDHIIPISSAKTEGELLKLFHHTNYQPLCSKINREIKKDKYVNL